MGDSDAQVAGERNILVASLDDARHDVTAALEGVPVALLREPLIWPEGSLLAIVGHLAVMERWWFAHTFAGLDVTTTSPERDARREWRLAPTDSVSTVVARYRDECRRSRLIIERAALDAPAARPTETGQTVVLRWVLVHMIDETSRHAGHADVLRQLIDGAGGTPPCSATAGQRSVTSGRRTR
jgi:hypothetical protein